MDDRSLVVEKLISELKIKLTENWHCSWTLSPNGHAWYVGPWVKLNKNFKERGDLEVSFPHVGCAEDTVCSEKSSSNLSERNVDSNCCSEDSYTRVSRNIMKESESWRMKIKECNINSGKIIVKMKRDDVFKEVLSSVHSKGLHYGSLESNGEVSVSTDLIPEDCDLSLRRLALTTKVLGRILVKLGYSVSECPPPTDSSSKLYFSVNPCSRQSNVPTVVCGVVRNILDRKREMRIRSDSYHRMRERDMEHASVHKYGPSVLQPSWRNYLTSVTDAVVTVDLLFTNPRQTVFLDLQDKFVLNREKSGKGATFLLYNYARLVSVLKQFNEKVSEGYYPPITPIEESDFSLLSCEEEWTLLYNYLMPYPSLLVQLVNPKELKFNVHLILKFMQDLCKCLSGYYSRVHILMEPRKHLLPQMYSRLHLISGIKILMQSIFTLFNIHPVSQM